MLNVTNKTKPLPQLNPVSMRQQVLEVLRAAIINGDMKPGHRLTEELICEQMAVSRGPVREAMRELEVEGLIISVPYKGAEVLDINDTEVFELLMPIRLLIEEFGFRYALQNATDKDFAALQIIVDRMAQAAKKGDVDDVVAADVEFHETVLRLSGQVHCMQIWRTISPRVRAYFSRWRHQNPDLDEVVREHRQLLEDFRKKDEAKVMSRLKEHIFVMPTVQHTARPGRQNSSTVQKNAPAKTPSAKRPPAVARRRTGKKTV